MTQEESYQRRLTVAGALSLLLVPICPVLGIPTAAAILSGKGIRKARSVTNPEERYLVHRERSEAYVNDLRQGALIANQRLEAMSQEQLDLVNEIQINPGTHGWFKKRLSVEVYTE